MDLKCGNFRGLQLPNTKFCPRDTLEQHTPLWKISQRKWKFGRLTFLIYLIFLYFLYFLSAPHHKFCMISPQTSRLREDLLLTSTESVSPAWIKAHLRSHCCCSPENAAFLTSNERQARCLLLFIFLSYFLCYILLHSQHKSHGVAFT